MTYAFELTLTMGEKPKSPLSFRGNSCWPCMMSAHDVWAHPSLLCPTLGMRHHMSPSMKPLNPLFTSSTHQLDLCQYKHSRRELSPDLSLLVQPMANPPSSPFFGLPLEIRYMIYAHYFTSHDTIRFEGYDENNGLLPVWTRPPLLSVCKQMRLEANEGYFLNRQFWVYGWEEIDRQPDEEYSVGRPKVFAGVPDANDPPALQQLHTIIQFTMLTHTTHSLHELAAALCDVVDVDLLEDVTDWNIYHPKTEHLAISLVYSPSTTAAHCPGRERAIRIHRTERGFCLSAARRLEQWETLPVLMCQRSCLELECDCHAEHAWRPPADEEGVFCDSITPRIVYDLMSERTPPPLAGPYSPGLNMAW